MRPEAARLGLPPCPDVLAILMGLATNGRPDAALASACIARDPELAAALLVAVNAPRVGLAPKVRRIADAIAAAGIEHCAKLAAGLLLSRCIAGFEVPGSGGCWDRITGEGLAIGYVARELGVASFDDAQLFGLFRHCAVPFLAARFGIGTHAGRDPDARDDADIVRAERELCGIDHAAAGALFAQTWGIHERICAAIARHHEAPDALAQGADAGDGTCRLVAVGALVDACIASLRCREPSDRPTGAERRAADLLGVSPAVSRALRTDIALLLGSDLGERLHSGGLRRP